GPEPGIVAAEEIGCFFGDASGAVLDQGVAIDAAGHDVADEGVASVFGREIFGVVMDHAGEGSGAVVVSADVGSEAKAVVRFAKAGIVSAAQELIDGRAVAIGRPKIAEGIEHQAKGMDQATNMLLCARDVRFAA